MRMGQRRPVLLTVDDHRAIHEVNALAFEKDHTHVRAYAGREALEIVRARTVDVVVLDLIMPDLNGLEVPERALKVQPGLMVVIALVIDSSQSALRALRRGATDYFVSRQTRTSWRWSFGRSSRLAPNRPPALR
jgi:DNA-binding NtrC family response regulator